MLLGPISLGLNNKRNRFANASQKFRETIIDEIGSIYPNPTNWPKNPVHIGLFLKSKFTTLQAAVEKFSMALPTKNKRKAFEYAWLCYHCPSSQRHNKDNQGYEHYIPIASEDIDGKPITKETTLEKCKETFKHNVEQLLKFANKT